MADTNREAMLARRAEVMAANPEITEASDLAPLMGDLEQSYWRWQAENHVAGKCPRCHTTHKFGPTPGCQT